MKKKSLFVVAAFLAVFVLQGCSTKPEQSLLKSYFNAVSLKDNTTMASMALEPMALEADSWEIVRSSEESIEPAFLPELDRIEVELRKTMEANIGPTVDAKDELDFAKEDLDAARTAAARNAARKKVDELQAKYDEIYERHRALQREYNDARAAAAREEEITRFSLGARDLPNARSLTGSVHMKDVDVKVTKDGGERTHRLTLRKYDLRDEAMNLHHRGRWIIVRFESLD